MRTVAHISDLHFGRHSTTVAEDLLASIEQSRPDLVALSGDFTQRARQAEFAQAQRFLCRIRPPKLVVPGNHDVPLYNLLGRFLTPFAKYNQYISPLGLPTCFYRDEEIAVLGLNTARRFTHKNGRVSVEQMAQLRRVFGELPAGIFKVLVTHHPLGMPGGEAPLELAGRSVLALQAIAAAEVHLLLSGHHHRALGGHLDTELGCSNSVLILHAGTAISTRTRGVDGNSYNLIRIGGHQFAVSVMKWEPGQGFCESRAFSFVLTAGKWRARQ